MTRIYIALPMVMLSALTACAGLKPDYVAPTSGSIATIEVRNNEDVANRRVLVHGDDICKADQAKLVGILKSKTVGIDYQEALSFNVSANKPVSISSSWSGATQVVFIGIASSVKIQYCQPVVTFTPEQGKKYKINFVGCTASISEVDKNKLLPTKSTMNHNCEIGKTPQDATRMFFLQPKQ